MTSTQLPRTLDSRFRSLTPQQLEQFAREDPKIRRHLDVVRRKELLEHVLKEMEALRALEAREKRAAGGGSGGGGRDITGAGRRRGGGLGDDGEGGGKGKRSWGLF